MATTVGTAAERPENCDDVLKQCEGLAIEIDATLSRLVSKDSGDNKPEPVALFPRLSSLRETLTGILEHAREAADRAGSVL